MKKKLKKEVDKWKKLQDVFHTTKHKEREAIRLKWKYVNLDKDDRK